MKTTSLVTSVFLFSLMAGSLTAATEQESLKQLCERQEARIRELEAQLGIVSATPPPPTNGVETQPASPVAPAHTEPIVSTTPASWYEVQAGDTIERIAKKHGCSVSTLLADNQLKSNSVIRPGQKLQLPIPKHRPDAQTSPETQEPAIRHEATATHRIAQGETFAAIARKYRIPLQQLIDANPKVKPTALRTGQLIQLGTTSRTEPSPPASASGSAASPAAKEEIKATPPSESVPANPAAAIKIQPVFIDREMTYLEFAQHQGTTIVRLNELNGLDLTEGALLAKGSELLAPTTQD